MNTKAASFARSTNEMQLTRISQVEKERRGVAPLNSDLRPVKNRILSPRTTNPSQCISSSRPSLSLIVPSVCRLTLVLPQPSPLTLFHTGHPLSLSLFLISHFVPLHPFLPPSSLPHLALPPFPNHLTFHRPSVSPAPFSRTILYALPRSLSPPFSVAPGVPLVPVPVVDSTSARSRFANIARKRRRRRDYDRIRNRPPESRRNFQVYSQVLYIHYVRSLESSRDNNKVSPKLLALVIASSISRCTE